MPFWFFYPFCEVLQNLWSKNTPLLFKELNELIIFYTPLLVKGEVLNRHMK
jgi:hypothetical protein